MADLKKLGLLGLRVYNGKMIKEVNEKGEVVVSDEADIEALVQRTFNSGSPSPEMLHQFNEVVIRTAEVIAEPKIKAMLELFTKYDAVADGTIKLVKLPKTKEKARIVYTANGVGVDYVRLSQDATSKPALPVIMSTGAYYELSDFSGNAVEAFNNVVDTVSDSMVQFYYDEVKAIMNTAVTNGDVPASNCAIGAGLSLAEFKEAESTMIRLSPGRPVFIADSKLIETLAMKQAGVVVDQNSLVTEDLKKALTEDLYITNLSKSIAVNLVNPFTSDAHDEVAFPVNEGYLFPAGIKAKPIEITKYGEVKQFSTFDIETERVLIKIKFKVSIDLIDAKRIGVVRDTSLSL